MIVVRMDGCRPCGPTIQGTLAWVLSVLGFIYLGISSMSLGVSALFSAGGVIETGGSAVRTGASGLSDLTSGDVDDILARPDDFRTARTVDVATVPREEAQSVVSGVQALVARAHARAADAAAEAEPYAAVGWIAFAAMVLSLLAAVDGATWGGARATRLAFP